MHTTSSFFLELSEIYQIFISPGRPTAHGGKWDYNACINYYRKAKGENFSRCQVVYKCGDVTGIRKTDIYSLGFRF